MNCDSVRDLISDYLEGSIDYRVWDSFISHIDGCASCKAEIESFKQTWNVLDSLPEMEVPVSFRHDVVMRAARLQHEKAQRRLRFPDLSSVFARPLRSVGMAVVAVGVALLMVKVTVPLHHFSAGMGTPIPVEYGELGSSDSESPWDSSPEMGEMEKWQSRRLDRNSVWITVTPNDTGNGRTVYRVLLSLNPNSVKKNTFFGRVGAQVSLLPPNAYDIKSDKANLVWEGNILSTNPVLVPVIVDRYQGRREGVNLLVTWRFRGREFSEIVYIPAHLGASSSKEVYDLSGDFDSRKSEPDLYSSLQRVAEEYGRIIISPAGIRGDSPVVFVQGQTLNDTLRATLKPWKLDWLSQDRSIYVDREYPW